MLTTWDDVVGVQHEKGASKKDEAQLQKWYDT
jgi:hypothetical protein